MTDTTRLTDDLWATIARLQVELDAERERAVDLLAALDGVESSLMTIAGVAKAGSSAQLLALRLLDFVTAAIAKAKEGGA